MFLKMARTEGPSQMLVVVLVGRMAPCRSNISGVLSGQLRKSPIVPTGCIRGESFAGRYPCRLRSMTRCVRDAGRSMYFRELPRIPRAGPEILAFSKRGLLPEFPRRPEHDEGCRARRNPVADRERRCRVRRSTLSACRRLSPEWRKRHDAPAGPLAACNHAAFCRESRCRTLPGSRKVSVRCGVTP